VQPSKFPPRDSERGAHGTTLAKRSDVNGGHSPANVTHHLKGMHFPASKEDLLARASDNGAGQDVLEVLESFPEGDEFENLADVMKAYGEADQAPQSGVIDRKP
jgi:hypothetical protein